MKQWLILVPPGIYLAVILASLIVVRRLRPTRWPFKIEDRLLRGPGESLRKEITKIDESILLELLGGVLAALMVVPLTVSASLYLGASPVLALAVAGVAFLALSSLSASRLVKSWKRRQALYLGWFGERVVAEKLAPLRFSGWHVFHDVPFVRNGKPFNIDHVVVGEGGLFVLETKVRRKGGGRSGQADDHVVFDGQALHWPRFKNDEEGLEQAERNATTLSAWIKEELGFTLPATPILVIPAWSLKFTQQREPRQCRVDSANWIQNTFKDRAAILPPQTVELVTRRLLAKCRDVDD